MSLITQYIKSFALNSRAHTFWKMCTVSFLFVFVPIIRPENVHPSPMSIARVRAADSDFCTDFARFVLRFPLH